MTCPVCEYCCSCHISAPCSFCMTHSSCDICGTVTCDLEDFINPSNGETYSVCSECLESGE